MRAETATTRHSLRQVVCATGALLLCCTSWACGPVTCPPGTKLDGKFCRKNGGQTSGSGEPTAGSSLAEPIFVAGAASPLSAAGGGGVVGSPMH
jgi:hypothetical protein